MDGHFPFDRKAAKIFQENPGVAGVWDDKKPDHFPVWRKRYFGNLELSQTDATIYPVSSKNA